MTLFDGYLIVDWSANSKRKTGKDSIWWCYLQGGNTDKRTVRIENPATRFHATEQIIAILKFSVKEDRRILVGFDFSYGYPMGFASDLTPAGEMPWLSVWEYLASEIKDETNNKNNRFEVASEINRIVNGGIGPFWGCPASQQTNYLTSTRPTSDIADRYPEFRLTEQGNSTHSVWKLHYAGSVGSQVLMGLPRLYQLLHHPDLRSASCVWPFQTGLRTLSQSDLNDIKIVHAEIYPSMIEVRPDPKEIKDRAQVRQLAAHFADLDKQGRLAELFLGRPGLTKEQQQIVEREEGWILGMV